MVYEPITDDKKQEWINWLDQTADILRKKPDNIHENWIFGTPEGDVRTGKDLVANLLATLTNTPVDL